ncbi:MAG: transporter permease [Betaproteobacteria bacterium]|nr:transporter permease [Betaproteobacteria bacterium]
MTPLPKWVNIVVPLLIAALALAAWEAVVRVREIPPYVIPAPSLVLRTLISDWPTLWPALLVTLKITVLSLLLAVAGGVLLAFLFSLSPWIELSLVPFAVILQVTPIIAIAPLIIIYAPNTLSALLICAWIVAFFPILSNTTVGLRSADRNLQDLFALYGATRWQRLRYLLAPSALPYFLAGLKIAGGLSLIGTVVAEYAAGTSGQESGLAYRILEASFRLNVPRMFAALLLVAATGIVIYFAFNWLSHALLHKWHESELDAGR